MRKFEKAMWRFLLRLNEKNGWIGGGVGW